jgi:hypothetical protein
LTVSDTAGAPGTSGTSIDSGNRTAGTSPTSRPFTIVIASEPICAPDYSGLTDIPLIRYTDLPTGPRKVVKPVDFADLDELAARLIAFEPRFNAAAHPFDWRFTRADLDDLLKRIDAHRAGPMPAAAA